MIRMSLIFSLFLFSAVVYAHPPCGAGYHNSGGNPSFPGQLPRAGFGTNRCGSYGCVNGRPAVIIPGYPNGGPYPPATTRIIIERK